MLCCSLMFCIPTNILSRLLFVASSAKNLILLSPLRTPVSTFNLDKQHFHLSFLKKKNIFTLSIGLLLRFFFFAIFYKFFFVSMRKQHEKGWQEEFCLLINCGEVKVQVCSSFNTTLCICMRVSQWNTF